MYITVMDLCHKAEHTFIQKQYAREQAVALTPRFSHHHGVGVVPGDTTSGFVITRRVEGGEPKRHVEPERRNLGRHGCVHVVVFVRE